MSYCFEEYPTKLSDKFFIVIPTTLLTKFSL